MTVGNHSTSLKDYSTEAKQDTGNASLASVDAKLTTANASLAAIDAGVPLALGQTTKSASMPVVLPSDQDFATGAKQDTGNASLASIDAGIPVSLGQKTSANSMPVVLSSDYQLPVVQQIVNSPFYEDMNVSTGGVTRDTQISTSFTSIYSYTGAGLFYGFRVTFESLGVMLVRVLIDGVDYFMGSTGFNLADASAAGLYNLSSIAVLGISIEGNSFTLYPPGPLKFAASIVVRVAVISGASKKFKAGFAVRSA